MKFRVAPSFATAPITLLVVLLAGCATPPARLPAPLPIASSPAAPAANGQVLAGTAQAELRESATPTPPGEAGEASVGLSMHEPLPPGLGGEPISVNLTNLPLPTFVNEVLGNSLGLTFQMEPAVQKLNDLVTLRTSRPQSPAEFYRIARQVLAGYGVEMVVEGDVVRLRVAPAGTQIEPPIIYSGRALPDVPITHRPIFYLMELDAIRANEATRWLRAIYGDEVKIEESAQRNALLISGRPEQVRQAVEAIRVFDRPSMRGRASIRLEPAFLSADQLASKLTEVLVAEGYGASTTLGVPSSVLLLPVPAVNSVIVFASDHDVLRHTVAWAHELDQPNPTAGNQSVFYYQVQNTKAADIASVLNGARSNARTAPNETAAAPAAAPAPAQGGAGVSGYTLIVDEPRNALIFQGDPADWERLLPLIHEMDKEARQVMIEVTIAEVTLDDSEEFGVSWFAKTFPDRFNGNVGFGSLPTPSPTSVAGSGLTYLLDVAGQSRAMLKAFADDQRVTILSTPRLMVKSGEQASIDVGTEVPIITSRTTSQQQTDGNTGLLQSIQYRKTGIILSIEPTVYSDDRVDLTISQEVSEALPVAEGDAISSPSIFNRSVETSLSLRDGGSVVIGGLMSTRNTDTDSGVPYLKDVPILGNLFKTQSERNSKTELVIMIVPYIIGSDQRAAEVTRAIGNELQLLELPVGDTAGTSVKPVAPAAEGAASGR